MSSKLLSWVWFGIAIIALLLFMYYQSQRNKALAPTSDTATTTDMAATNSDTGSAANVEGSVKGATVTITDKNSGTTQTQASSNSGPTQERNIGMLSSMYDTSDGRTWAGIDFVSYYTGANAVAAAKAAGKTVSADGTFVSNGSTQIYTFKLAMGVTIMLKTGTVTTAGFMSQFNDPNSSVHSALFRFTFNKATSEVASITEL